MGSKRKLWTVSTKPYKDPSWMFLNIVYLFLETLPLFRFTESAIFTKPKFTTHPDGPGQSSIYPCHCNCVVCPYLSPQHSSGSVLFCLLILFMNTWSIFWPSEAVKLAWSLVIFFYHLYIFIPAVMNCLAHTTGLSLTHAWHYAGHFRAEAY